MRPANKIVLFALLAVGGFVVGPSAARADATFPPDCPACNPDEAANSGGIGIVFSLTDGKGTRTGGGFNTSGVVGTELTFTLTAKAIYPSGVNEECKGDIEWTWCNVGHDAENAQLEHAATTFSGGTATYKHTFDECVIDGTVVYIVRARFKGGADNECGKPWCVAVEVPVNLTVYQGRWVETGAGEADFSLEGDAKRAVNAVLAALPIDTGIERLVGSVKVKTRPCCDDPTKSATTKEGTIMITLEETDVPIPYCSIPFPTAGLNRRLEGGEHLIGKLADENGAPIDFDAKLGLFVRLDPQKGKPEFSVIAGEVTNDCVPADDPCHRYQYFTGAANMDAMLVGLAKAEAKPEGELAVLIKWFIDDAPELEASCELIPAEGKINVDAAYNMGGCDTGLKGSVGLGIDGALCLKVNIPPLVTDEKFCLFDVAKRFTVLKLDPEGTAP